MEQRKKQTSVQIRDLVIQYFEGDENGKKSEREVAKLLKIPKSTVHSIISKYKRTGKVEDLKGRGRKATFSEREERAIVRKVKANSKISATKMVYEVEKEFGKSTSRFTIKRILKKAGFESYFRRRKPLVSKVNMKKRLQFAREHVNKPQSFWNSILWSDESKFNIFGSDGRARCWRKKGEALKLKNLNASVKHGGGSAMIWGCFAASGTGKYEFIDTTMDQYVYQGIISRNVKESARNLSLGRQFVFQQDQDPKHTAKSTLEFFKDNNLKLLKWPPQSPDLNPIEHLWDHVEREIRKTTISNKNDLKREMSMAFQHTPIEVTKTLVQSMQRRCQAVIASRGGPTRY
jgi:transposase